MPKLTEEDFAVEAKKRLLLKVGVGIFSALIIGFWLFSFRLSASETSRSEASSSEMDKWQEEFVRTINTMRSGLESDTEEAETTQEGKDFLSEMVNNLEESEEGATGGSDLTASNTPVTATITPEQMLKELEGRLPAPVQSCPEFINCMPTIGEARPCVIPPGCENITQIAY